MAHRDHVREGKKKKKVKLKSNGNADDIYYT